MLTRMTQAPTENAEPQAESLAVGTVEAARLLDVSRRYLMYLISSGQITTSRLPSARTGLPHEHRIERAELKAFLDRTRGA